ncbi:MAG: metallophosphoesterase family protein, partial [Syntrophobacteraceae bacterium]
LIGRKTRDWLRGLDARLVFEGALFVHGSPPDSLTRYLFDWTDAELASLFQRLEQRLCFVGHTHTPGAIAHENGRIVHYRLKQGIFTLQGAAGYIICVGSVGQPRDGINNNAKYVIWDTLQSTVEVRFVAYDAARTAEKIIAAGLPEEHARRLL